MTISIRAFGRAYIALPLIAIIALIIPTPAFAVEPNLVSNASLETASSDANIPLDWFKGYDDAGNAVTYTYPVLASTTPSSDISSGKAARVSATTLSGGTDAKWYFKPVPVTALEEYTFTDAYISNVNTDLVAVFCTNADCSTLASPAFAFVSVPASGSDWAQANATFTVPAGTTYMTVFHRIATPGTLTIDSYTLSHVTPPTPFAKGLVSFTFDDGLLSQLTNARTLLSNAGVKGTFYIVSHVSSGFSIVNAGFEQPVLTGWTTTGAGTFGTVAGGHTGNAGFITAATSSPNGQSLTSAAITVLPDSIYSATGWFKTTAALGARMSLQVTLANGSTLNADVVDAAGATLGTSPYGMVSASSTWAAGQAYFYVPVNAKSVKLTIEKSSGTGTLYLDDIAFGGEEYMTKEQVLSLQTDGHEIGNHTQTHSDLTAATTNTANEIAGGKAELESNGVATIKTLAYPYGAFNAAVETVTQNAGYDLARTVVPGFNGKNSPKYALFSQSVNNDTTQAQVDQWIAKAAAQKLWLILTFHDIKNDTSSSAFGATPGMLSSIIAAAKAANVDIIEMKDGLVKMNATETQNHIITATLPMDAHGSISPFNGVMVADGADQSFVITAADGYHIMDVIVDGASKGVAGTYTFSQVAADHSITATFAANSSGTTNHTITASAGTHGSISPAGSVSVADGSGQAFSITADSGYHVSDVLVDNVSVGAVTSYTFNANNANHSIAASFAADSVAPATHTITASAAAHGAISPAGSVSVADGSSQTFTITAESGYAVDGVLVDGASVGAVTTYTFNANAANHSIAASFSKKSSGGSSGGSGGTKPTTPTTGTTTGSVLGATTYNFTKDLFLGSSGNDVTELQKVLVKEGFLKVAPTGYFGTATFAAVKAYQKAHGISPVSGYVGAKTRVVLNKGSQPLAVAMTRDEIQAKINELLALLASRKNINASATFTP